ncbi:MAG: DUF262 domain-containing protein [Bacteroidota bacterium]
MDKLAPTELTMWQDDGKKPSLKMSAQEINEKYVKGEQRIITESNREKLPNFVEALRRQNYMTLRPFYQRRKRWDEERQSTLIESFIINVPVPPIFLYEKSYNSYEVMDGQQRITAIKDFYDDKLRLTGLEIWHELNGMLYKDLPNQVKAGIDRRSISSIVLLKESAPDDEEAMLLRQLVFERLNTGGVKLEKQEVRNALYQGGLNNLLLGLSRLEDFRKAWNLPSHSEDEDNDGSNADIFGIGFFQKMEDLEVILRFFALRHVEHYRGGLAGFLDLYMVRSRMFTKEDIIFLQDLFVRTLRLGREIFEDLIFQHFDPGKQDWMGKKQKPFADAVMVGLSRHLDQADILGKKRLQVIEGTKNLFSKYEPGTFSGRNNTKADVQGRINYFSEMLDEVIKS